jgi:hypothetical protein
LTGSPDRDDPHHVTAPSECKVENVAVSFANRPEAILAVIAPGILPDQNRPGENSGGIVETDAAFAQRPDVLCLVPTRILSEVIRL